MPKEDQQKQLPWLQEICDTFLTQGLIWVFSFGDAHEIAICNRLDIWRASNAIG